MAVNDIPEGERKTPSANGRAELHRSRSGSHGLTDVFLRCGSGPFHGNLWIAVPHDLS